MALQSTVGSVGNYNRMIEAVNAFRDVHPDMTLNQVVVMLLVASRPGITQRQIMEETGLADSSTSRIIGILGKWGNRGTKPLNLIDVVYDEADRRVRTYTITPTGRKLLEKVMAALTKGGR